jgi:hypothetical protein
MVPVTWQRIQEGKEITFTTTVEGRAWANAFRSLWQVFAAEVVPAHIGVDWDHVRVHLWNDSGRVIVFPASSTTKWRIDKALCDLVLTDVFNEFEYLLESGVPDDLFEARMKEINCDTIIDLVQQAKAVDLASMVGRGRLRIAIYLYGDELLAEHELVPKALRGEGESADRTCPNALPGPGS